MLSVHGVYENGKITLKRPATGSLPGLSKVIITFTDFSLNQQRGTESEEAVDTTDSHDGGLGKGNDYYASLREYERVLASGNIIIIDGDDHFTFPLFDYSQGGLCFFATKAFKIGQNIRSGITHPSNPEMILMELEMEVRSAFKSSDSFKIGCMFIDPVDEDLWHGLLQYLS